MGKNFNPTTGQFDADQLFKPWIPAIYATNLPKDVEEMLRGVIKTPIERLKHFLLGKKAIGGGFFSADKTDDILIWYPVAGFMLRSTETALARKQSY